MKQKVYKTALAAILCAQALVLAMLEGMLPQLPFMPPGAKPGFSNIITMFAAGNIGLPTALAITAVKGGFAFVTRGATAGFMSVSGGLLSTIAMYFLLKYAKKLGLVGVSVISALCHNFGQLVASTVLTGTAMTLYYAPVTVVFGVITGILTGVILKAVMPALEKQKKYFVNK